MRGPPPSPTLFPYTTLFRSVNIVFARYRGRSRRRAGVGRRAVGVHQFRHVVARGRGIASPGVDRSEEHTSELQSLRHLVCRLLLEKKDYEPELREVPAKEHK